MTLDQIKSVVSRYVEDLTGRYEPIRHSTSNLPLRTEHAVRHALWMCEQIMRMGEADLEKAQRWLGFVQGVLWLAWERTIDDMRKDNRGGWSEVTK